MRLGNTKRRRLNAMVPLVILSCAIFIGVLATSPVDAQPMATHTVCPSGCNFPTIQAAITAADHGDTIQLLILSAHTEYGIVVNKSVTIEGLGEFNTTVQAAASSGSAPNRVFFIVAGLDVRIRDMTIKNGDTFSTGGGVHNEGSNVTLTNIDFLANEASDGGAIYSSGGMLTLINVSVLNNSVSNKGGGVYSAGTLIMENSNINNNENYTQGGGVFTSGVATIRNSDVSYNDVLASGGFNMQGGGIYNEGTLHIFDSTIRYNELAGAFSASSLIGGGGIYSSGGEFQLIDSTVANNTVSGEQDGGGLYLNNSNTTIRRSVINNNRSDGSFSNTGGLYMTSGSLTMIDTTVRDNWGDVGGGLYLSNGTVDIRHVTISGNESNYGGGLYICGNQGTMAFTNVTISDNDATNDGGGIYVCSIGEVSLANSTISENWADNDDNGSGNGGGIYLHTFNGDIGNANLRNTILAGNHDRTDFPSIAAHDCYGVLNSEGYNFIGTLGFAIPNDPCAISGDGTGNIVGGNAMLDVLADNGGPTLTHALLSGSGAVNGGNLAGCTDYLGDPVLTDQRHGIRPDRCDMGAFELGALVEQLYLPTVLKD